MKNLTMILVLLSFFSTPLYAKSTFSTDSYSKDTVLKIELFKKASNKHKALGYNPAKKYLFGQLHLEKNADGYFIKDLYCDINYTAGAGPMGLPDQSKINCEHTWPQSKFTSSFPTELQKSDLHHLFPTDSRANSTRGNYEFADVVSNENLKNCKSSRSGASVTGGGHTYFEPPTSHKGNVARAIFYFSIRYKLEISAQQEEFLRRWNDIDPVDSAEMARNVEIEKLQGNRNPFIDNPEYIDAISNF